MIIHTLSNCKWNTGYLGIPRYFITIPYRFVFSDTVQPYCIVLCESIAGGVPTGSVVTN